MLFTSALIISCCKTDIGTDNKEEETSASSDSIVFNPDWTYASHGKADPDYLIVFPQSSVNKIELSMTSSQWNSVRSNMKSLFGYDFAAILVVVVVFLIPRLTTLMSC